MLRRLIGAGNRIPGTALLSRHQANWLSFAIFWGGLFLVWNQEIIWPGVLLVVGFSYGLKNYFRGHWYRGLMHIAVFTGFFFSLYTEVERGVVFAVVFAIGGITLLFQELFLFQRRSPEEREEDFKEETRDE